MPTATAISILALHIILALVLVLLVRDENSAVGHARSRRRRGWLFTAEMA